VLRRSDPDTQHNLIAAQVSAKLGRPWP